jgi:hypothetical protein
LDVGNQTRTKETVQDRLRRYQRVQHRDSWIVGAVGFAGLAVLASSDLAANVLSKSEPIFGSLVLTLIIVAGVLFVGARANLEGTLTKLRDKVEAGELRKEDSAPPELDLPRQFSQMWVGSLISIVLATIAFLVGIWWPLLPWSQQ